MLQILLICIIFIVMITIIIIIILIILIIIIIILIIFIIIINKMKYLRRAPSAANEWGIISASEYNLFNTKTYMAWMHMSVEHIKLQSFPTSFNRSRCYWMRFFFYILLIEMPVVEIELDWGSLITFSDAVDNQNIKKERFNLILSAKKFPGQYLPI